MRSKPKWAVENVHSETGERVRVMETHQDWVAELIAEQANAGFVAGARSYRAQVIRIRS